MVVKFIPNWCPVRRRALLCDSGSPRGRPGAGAPGRRVPTGPPSSPPPPRPRSRSDPPATARLAQPRGPAGTELPPARLPGPRSYFLFRSVSGRAPGSARTARRRPLGWTGWISLESKGLSRVFSNTTVQKHQFFGAQLFLEKEINKNEKNVWACQIKYLRAMEFSRPEYWSG